MDSSGKKMDNGCPVYHHPNPYILPRNLRNNKNKTDFILKFGKSQNWKIK